MTGAHEFAKLAFDGRFPVEDCAALLVVVEQRVLVTTGVHVFFRVFEEVQRVHRFDFPQKVRLAAANPHRGGKPTAASRADLGAFAVGKISARLRAGSWIIR